jgi:hypothetical protein
MPSDFDEIRGLGLPGQSETDAAMQQTQQSLAGLRDFGARGAAQQKDQGPEDFLKYAKSLELTTDAEGNVGLNAKGVNLRFLQGLLSSQKQLNEIMGSFHQEASRLQAQEEQARQQPWMQLATALSANLAQARDMPGWVQALGRTAGQMNPSVQELQARRMQLMGAEAGIAEKSAGLNISAAGLTERAADRKDLRARQAREDLDKDIDHFIRPYVTAAEARTLPPKFEDFARTMMTRIPGVAANQVVSSYESIESVAKGRQTRYVEEQEGKKADRVEAAKDIGRALMPIRVETAKEIKRAQESESDKAIEIVAKSLAAGDLSSIRDITGFRGDQRIKVYARAKELNPNFSVAETNRKIAMEQSFTVGKDGVSLQSFGTFLEHAGEVSETLKGLYQSGSPAFNKPMNWWRKNMTGSPEYQRLLVSLEPVGKEFESFLLNQRALYADDRRQIDILLNGSSTPAQIMAALNQMGKTAKDRYTEMNHRYKRVMKQDLESPFGPEATVAAAKIGINLKTAPSKEEPEFPWEKK